jgi:hypothetical protein
VETNFELREPESGTDPATPQGQRQIFLRHGVWHIVCKRVFFPLICGEIVEQIRVLTYPRTEPKVEVETPGAGTEGQGQEIPDADFRF